MTRFRILMGAATLLLVGLVAGIGGWIVYGSNTPSYDGERRVTLPDATTESLDAVVDSLTARGILRSPTTFRLVATTTGWDAQIKPGHYAFESGASNHRLLDDLRRGLQSEVRVTIPPGSRPEVVAAVAARRLRFNKKDFLAALRDTSLAQSLDVAPQDLFGYMLPETYFFYWQTPPEAVIRRVKEGFDRFYEREIAVAADSLDLTKQDVVTLASIVEWEALLDAEKPRIAGVYLNRLDDGWKLQADPTVQYVLMDTQGSRTRRVLYRHLEIDHPYNTYRNRGLPPGPITNPAPSTVRAIANAENHGYFYFAADGTGGHTFSRTLREHNRAARAYHRLLDERRRKKTGS